MTELNRQNIRLTFQAFHEPISSLHRLSMALKRKSKVEGTAPRNLQDLADKGIVVPTEGGHSIHYKANLQKVPSGSNMRGLVLPPPDSEEFIFLARRVGYTTDDWQAAARHLQTDIEQHMNLMKDFSERMFGEL